MLCWDDVTAGLAHGELVSWADLACSDGVVVAADLHVVKMEVARLVSVTLVRKEMKKMKKKKNLSLLHACECRQWWWQDLQGLRGNARWRGGGLRTRHMG